MTDILDANDTVLNSYTYDAFGNTLTATEGIKNVFKYAGEQYDETLGKYYLRACYYDPVHGRFTQEDTYRGDGNNLYVYVATKKIRSPLSVNQDGFIEIEVKKQYFENTNISVYESGDGYFHVNPLSAYVGKKVSFRETGEDEERFTIDDMQALNSKHKLDKWYGYGKVALNLGSDILTVSTFGTGAAASASAKEAGIAFVKVVVPTTAKEGVEFALIQGGQMAGDYYFYDSKPTDDLYKTAKSMLPGFGTYYALVNVTSKNTVLGLYSPIE